MHKDFILTNLHQHSAKLPKRYLQLDVIRGIAILLMVFFHFCFDLNNFKFISIDIYNQTSRDWFYFRMVILTLFITCVGISLALVYEHTLDYKKLLRRFLKIMAAAFIVSIASVITFPTTWIYFGVLHFIGVASLLGVLFVRYEYLALSLGITIVVGFNMDYLHMHWLYAYLKEPLGLPVHTEDLVPLTPWFGVVLIGIFIGKKRLFLFPLKEFEGVKIVAFLGKHSLLIYLVHQPLLFGSVALARFLLP